MAWLKIFLAVAPLVLLLGYSGFTWLAGETLPSGNCRVRDLHETLVSNITGDHAWSEKALSRRVAIHAGDFRASPTDPPPPLEKGSASTAQWFVLRHFCGEQRASDRDLGLIPRASLGTLEEVLERSLKTFTRYREKHGRGYFPSLVTWIAMTGSKNVARLVLATGRDAKAYWFIATPDRPLDQWVAQEEPAITSIEEAIVMVKKLHTVALATQRSPEWRPEVKKAFKSVLLQDPVTDGEGEIFIDWGLACSTEPILNSQIQRARKNQTLGLGI
jgi:hypothetical protein